MTSVSRIVLATFSLAIATACSQTVMRDPPASGADIFASHAAYREATLDNYAFTPEQVYKLIDRLHDDPSVDVEQLGESVEGRPIYALTVGAGPREILLWSQMHGDEPTATAAIFDLMNYMADPDNREQVERWRNTLTLRFIPMLNPDGGARFERRNAQGIDVNRDALRLQTPEGRILKAAVDRWQPDFGFNLHDHNRFLSANSPSQPATLSFLAPAFDEEKSVNPVRSRAMQLVGLLNQELQPLVPGQIGRYNDTWEPRAFGDNVQGWGVSTILVEAGGSPDDPGRELPRQLNFTAMILSFDAVASGAYRAVELDAYESLPFSRTRLFDLLVRNATVVLDNGDSYLTDVGINFAGDPVTPDSGDEPRRASIRDWGDLSTFAGYEEIDATGLTLTLPDCPPVERCPVDLSTLYGDVSFELRRDGETVLYVEAGIPTKVAK